MQIKVAGATLNQIPLDWSGNKRRILAAIEEARKQEAVILCLPELCLTGYGCEDVFFNPHVHESALDMLFELAPATKGMVVSFGLPLIIQGALFNATAIVADGRVIGFVPKKILAGDGVHYEPRWFKAWPADTRHEVEIRDKMYAAGDIYFDFNGVKMGLEICEEAWVAQRPGAKLARLGVDVILNPSASHFAFGKASIRQSFVNEGARAFNVVYVYSNLVGNEAGRIVFDGGILISDGGQLVAQGPRFSFAETNVTSSIVDIGRNRVVRSRTASHAPDLDQETDLCVMLDFTLPTAKGSAVKITRAPWETSEHLKEEEFTRAVSLGLFDFMRKSRQHGFVVSLSGGVDSAAVTLLCRQAFDFAEKEIGFKALKQKLNYIPFVSSATSVDEIARQMITTAYQATRNSSTDTLEAARAIAKDAGATFYNWSVDEILADYLKVAETALGEKLTWQKHDATLQNIQARSRGPSIWILANVKNALLLATSNRSEAAVGYATMDGDTCGGISPIGGIDKNFLRGWAKWMAAVGPHGLRPSKGFEKVLAKPPTAELRPADQHQTDEEDLMPYEILDEIEKLAIRDKKSPLECFTILGQRHPETDPKKMKSWVAKFFRLWCRNQWKRERYAPAFHLDDESLDPKTWCRFPILSSGFEEELKKLEAHG